MSQLQSKPSQRIANALISVIVICSVGALYDSWSCDWSCRYHGGYRRFFSLLPFYLLLAIIISEAISWGLLKKFFSGRKKPDVNS